MKAAFNKLVDDAMARMGAALASDPPVDGRAILIWMVKQVAAIEEAAGTLAEPTPPPRVDAKDLEAGKWYWYMEHGYWTVGQVEAVGARKNLFRRRGIGLDIIKRSRYHGPVLPPVVEDAP